MYSAYPSVSHNGTGGGSLAEALGITPGSPTATILGGVAVGVLGIALVAGAVMYFKKGGSVSGLVQKVKENKGLITKAASMLPLTDEQKAKVEAAVNDPTALLPKEAQQAIEVVQHAKEYEANVISSLPISEAQKAQLTTAVSSVHDKIVTKAAATPTGVQVVKLLKPSDLKPVQTNTHEDKVGTVTAVTTDTAVTTVPTTPTTTETPLSNTSETVTVASPPIPITPALVALHISEADVAEVQAFLRAKETKEAKEAKA